MEEIQLIIIVIGLALFMPNAMNLSEVDVTKMIGKAFVSTIIIGIGIFGPDLILKTLNPNSQPTFVESKAEKEKELSGEEKLKRLNAYRKSNHKNILLADASVMDQYLNYLKGKNLDETALK